MVRVVKQLNWKALFTSIAISLGAGFIGSIVSRDSMEQYKSIYKPPLSPPSWVFPIVWTILFVLMGIAAYLIYMSESEEKNQALKLYVVQLILNVGWSVIFFRWQAYLAAFFWLLLLWYFIWLTTKQFYQINEIAGKLMFPYLLWVTFAGYLNLAIAIHSFS